MNDFNKRSEWFERDAEGVWFHRGAAAEPVWVCEFIEVDKLTRDKLGKNWGKLVNFFDPDGGLKELNILQADLICSFSRVARRLQEEGLRTSATSNGLDLLRRYLIEQEPDGRAFLEDLSEE